MPLYEYKCESCGFVFEKLTSSSSEDTASCESCGNTASRQVSRFSSVIAGGSNNESVDMSIGRIAESRWQTINERRSSRHNGAQLSEVSIPKSSDGKYMPVMALGDNGERTKKVEYVSALQDHRKKRVEKGQGQFDKPGAF